MRKYKEIEKNGKREGKKAMGIRSKNKETKTGRNREIKQTEKKTKKAEIRKHEIITDKGRR